MYNIHIDGLGLHKEDGKIWRGTDIKTCEQKIDWLAYDGYAQSEDCTPVEENDNE